MTRNAVGRRFPLVMLYLAFCAVRTAVLIPYWHDQKTYRGVFDATMPLGLLVQSLAIVQVFWVMVEQYPNFRRVGAVGMALVGACSAAAVWLTSHLYVLPNPTVRDFELLMQRHGCMAMSAVLVGIAVLLPRSPDIPIRVSAVRAATILGIDAGLYLLISAVMLAVTPYASNLPLLVREAIALLPMCSKAVVAGLWLLWMTPESDFTTKAEPFTEADRWELMRLKLRLRPSGLR